MDQQITSPEAFFGFQAWKRSEDGTVESDCRLLPIIGGAER